VRTEATVSPPSANAFNAFKAESSRSWREGGDKPCHQESAFSLTTLPVQGGRPGSSLRR
jgi:enterochelin esterase-like enzyme